MRVCRLKLDSVDALFLDSLLRDNVKTMQTVGSVGRERLVDELLSSISTNRVTHWSALSLGVDQVTFASIVQRLFELEGGDTVDVLSVTREGGAGERRASQVKFVRVG